MRKTTPTIFASSLVLIALHGCSTDKEEPSLYASDPSLQLTSFDVSYSSEVDAIVFELEAAANTATLVPEKAGQTDGAPGLSVPARYEQVACYCTDADVFGLPWLSRIRLGRDLARPCSWLAPR